MKTSPQDQLATRPYDEPIVTVPVAALRYADSPRLHGESEGHIRVLAGINAAKLPPILVHRETMRVIDGMHRLHATLLRGQTEIRVKFFSGSETDAFVIGVRANIGHGLPLSQADREGAANRILASHPQWSDRTIAEAVGLASTTVARVRERAASDAARPEIRIGKDGRYRPMNGAAGRRAASRLFHEYPHASLREIAEQAGVSPATAKDVRERLMRGDDPVPPRLAMAEQKAAEARSARSGPSAGTSLRVDKVPVRLSRVREPRNTTLILQKLLRDPALRLNDNGRVLLRWLSVRSVSTAQWEHAADEVPSHCAELIADYALGIADEWVRFAETLNRKGSETA